MAIPGWQRTESPFHSGERAIQERLGALEQMDDFGRRIIREFLPEQHRQFYAQLSYFLVGTVDRAGNPWASILVGEPGFISTPNDRTLHIAARPYSAIRWLRRCRSAATLAFSASNCTPAAATA
jgi:hypothetical protein